MSSILDALNKLEEERNRQLQEEHAPEEDNAPFEPDEAAAKLLMYEPPSRKGSAAPERGQKTATGFLPKWVSAMVSLLALAAVVSSAAAMVLVYQMLQRTPPQQAYTVPVIVEPPAASAPVAPSAAVSSEAAIAEHKAVVHPAPLPTKKPGGESAAPAAKPASVVTPPKVEPVQSAVQHPAVPLPAETDPPYVEPAAAEPSAVSAAPETVESKPEPAPETDHPPAGSAMPAAPSPSVPSESTHSESMPSTSELKAADTDESAPKTKDTKVAQAASAKPAAAAGDGLTPPTGLPGNPPVVTPPALPVNPPSVLSTPSAPAAETVPARKSAGFVEPEAVNALPRLTLADQERYGLGELRLNVLREAGPGNPDPVAIINLKKVYLGERIPGTSARLIGISSRAIAIEIEGSGARFRVSR